jgi:hypothetical protein
MVIVFILRALTKRWGDSISSTGLAFPGELCASLAIEFTLLAVILKRCVVDKVVRAVALVRVFSLV